MKEENGNTKDIENLFTLRELAIDTLELDILDEMDENADESTENFEKAIETLENKEANKTSTNAHPYRLKRNKV